MWHETCAQGYHKCDTRHVHRVIRNMTWVICTGLSEMWHEKCVQLSEMCHETCAQGYQKSLITKNNHLCSKWPLCICIQNYRLNNISVYQATNKITYLYTKLQTRWLVHCSHSKPNSFSHTSPHIHCSNTVNICNVVVRVWVLPVQ